MQYIKLELGCLVIMIFLTFQYLQRKHIGTTTNKACRQMLLLGCCNLFLGAVAGLLLSYLGNIPEWLVRISYQLYYVSLCVFLCFAAYYLLSVVSSVNLLGSNNQMTMMILLLCAVIMTLVLPVYLRRDTATAFGPMTYVYQFATLFFMGFAGINLFRYHSTISNRRFDVFVPVILVILLLAILHFLVPSLAMSGVGIVLISLAAVMTADNSDDYLSADRMLFNSDAFAAVANDMLLRGKKVNAIFIAYRDMALMEDKLGKDCMRDVVVQLRDYLTTVFSIDMYIPLDTCAAVLVEDPKKADTIVFGIEQKFDGEWVVMGVPINILANVIRLEMPDPYPDVDELIKAAIEKSQTTQQLVVTLDKKLGIKNKKAFDRELLMLHQERKSHSSIYYLVADVAGMHKFNEKNGYIAGDKLLKDCVAVLSQAAGENVDVYRVGGDEFAMLLLDKTDAQMRDLLDRIQVIREECNKDRGQLPLEISIGYSRYYVDSDKTFNSMISRAQFQMSNLKKHMNQEVDLYNTTRLGTRLLK